ncbi:MAG: ATP-binding cassette domain-containing protein [Woeseia sp.]
MTELLSGKDLSLLRGERFLFQGLNFALSTGELLLVQGPNGSGKTSLLRAIAGLTSLESGHISWHGVSTERTARLLAPTSSGWDTASVSRVT